MKLDEYLRQEGISPTEFGKMLGLKSRTSVPRYLSGERRPREAIMKKIVSLTDGLVTPNSFFQ